MFKTFTMWCICDILKFEIDLLSIKIPKKQWEMSSVHSQLCVRACVLLK